MKKILGILSVITALGLIICVVIGFCGSVPSEVPSSSSVMFRLLVGLGHFLRFLPAVIITGFIVSCSIEFGQNPQGSANRFSAAMLGRYKTVMIASLICTALLTLSGEVFSFLISQKKTAIINQPKIINEYIRMGTNLFENAQYERAMRYAQAALELNPDSEAAITLRDNSEVEINRSYNNSLRFKLYEAEGKSLEFDFDHVAIDAEKISDVYTYYEKATDAFGRGEWFNAHYYAETGISLATPKDPNLDALRQLSASAWNNITQVHNQALTEEQKIYNDKYEGYKALVERDDLRAYYIFKELSERSYQLQIDPEVIFYLDIAQNRIAQRYFFIDETFELKSFESANDVYFSYQYDDGSRDIVYFKGMSAVKSTGNSLQYLRALTIESVDRFGNLHRSMTVPYAKVLPVSVQSINSTTKLLMGISDDIDYVPYLMLKSIERDAPGREFSPLYTYASGETASTPEYLILPVPFDDFVLLESASLSPDAISLFSLIRLLKKSDRYGFSDEIFGQVLLNRLFYPLLLLTMFLLLASFGWNNRIALNQYFRFSWIFSFPLLLLVATGFYELLLYMFRLLNYVLLGAAGVTASLVSGALVYVVFLVVSSVYFLARRS